MISENSRLTLKTIFIFWLPLAATWLMMAFESPFLNAIIARLEDPVYNLAAFGVSFSLAILIEAPIIMIMSAATALVQNRDSFEKLRIFTYSLNLIITLIMGIVILPPVFDLLGRQLIGLPPQAYKLAHHSTMILLPWPAAIGFRRFFQGILIRHQLPRRVAYGTVVRWVSMSVTALILFFLRLPGAYVGAIALTSGVIMESFASRLMVHKILKKIKGSHFEPGSDTEPLTYGNIFRFYYPLALTSILALGVHPLVTVFMGKSRLSLESLAVLPVVNALVFIFRAVGLSYQEVVIALMGKNRQRYENLKKFVLIMGTSLSAALALVAFTPLAKIWYHSVSGLDLDLSRLAYLPTQILVLLPGFTALISWQRAMMVYLNRTSPVSWATAIEVLVMGVVLTVTVFGLNMVGVVAAALAYLIGRFCGIFYLIPNQSKALSRIDLTIS
jgi:hypothetical protein